MSRDGARAHYAGGGGASDGPSTEARDSRAPFYANGANRCSFRGSVDDPGGWCDPFQPGAEDSAETSWDTSMVSGINGWIWADAPGEELITYKWGQAPTHHQGGHCKHTWRNNSGIEALVIRRDGWVSVTGAYNFPQRADHSLDLERLPQFTTIPLELPGASACQATEELVLALNVVTGMVGLALVELQDAGGAALAGFSLADADAVKGSYISKAVTWGHGKRRSLGAHAGRALRLRVALADAELYSVTFRCSAQ